MLAAKFVCMMKPLEIAKVDDGLGNRPVEDVGFSKGVFGGAGVLIDWNAGVEFSTQQAVKRCWTVRKALDLKLHGSEQAEAKCR